MTSRRIVDMSNSCFWHTHCINCEEEVSHPYINFDLSRKGYESGRRIIFCIDCDKERVEAMTEGVDTTEWHRVILNKVRGNWSNLLELKKDS